MEEEERTNGAINKILGVIFQEYRIKNKMTQEKLGELLLKSPKTISMIETGKNGTIKKTDIDFMNILGITPNLLYKSFITNNDLKKMIEIDEKISELDEEKKEALLKIIDILKFL